MNIKVDLFMNLYYIKGDGYIWIISEGVGIHSVKGGKYKWLKIKNKKTLVSEFYDNGSIKIKM